MTTNPKPEDQPTESKTIQEVRRWREEAGREWRALTPEERERRTIEMAKALGLPIVSPGEMTRFRDRDDKKAG